MTKCCARASALADLIHSFIHMDEEKKAEETTEAKAEEATGEEKKDEAEKAA